METITMSVNELVKAIATNSEKTQKEVREIVDVMKDVVIEQLREASEDVNVVVKVLPGISLTAGYVDAHEARDPRTGDTIKVAPKISVRTKIGPSFKEAVNQ